MTFKAPRGTHDLLPSDFPLWSQITGTAKAVCALYGYRPILTPGFEETELFRRTSGAGSDIVRKEMYTFEDLGGRSLTLRAEATAPICRAYVEHGLHREHQPQKLFTVAPMYRYDTPQKGRFREHRQLSVEAIGSDDPALDAELIQLYVELLRRLGVGGYRIELNSIGDRACRPAYVERLRSWLGEHDGELDAETRTKADASPLRVFDTKNPGVARALAAAPTIGESLCEACAAHFAAVRRYLDAYGVAYELVPTLVRGLDYYTRTTFEFVGSELGAQSSLVGGGRYDYLVEEIGGPPTPAIGFGAGIERLVMSLQAAGVEAPPEATEIFFAVGPGAPREQVLGLMASLRRAGRACDTDYAGRTVKGQLTQAQRVGARTIVVVGPASVTIRRRGAEDVEAATLEQAAALL
ncbi:MAG: histidine--tRNA ligase [Gaiellaceae bacterium]